MLLLKQKETFEKEVVMGIFFIIFWHNKLPINLCKIQMQTSISQVTY